ncbi:MAG: hypothetical protein EOO87_01840, partial [Pedobacter sp.]
MTRLNRSKYLRLFSVAIFALIFASCEPKRLGEEVFDLNDFPLGLSVSRFYENELKKENSENYSSYSDTSFNYKDGNRKAVAVKYNVSADKSVGHFAKLKNISFYNLASVTDLKDNLMMMATEADCGFADQMKLINELTKKHGKPIVKQHIASFTTFTWLLDDRTIQVQCEMIPDYENYKNKIDDFLNPDGGFLKSDSYEPNHIWKVYLYIFNNDYID